MGEWLKTLKCWKWRSFMKVTIPVVVRHNSSYDELVASVMQSGNLDCAPDDMVISYLMNLREKLNPTIINSDVSVLMYMMDVDTDDFRIILWINVAERSIEGLVNSLKPPPLRRAVNDDFNDYKSDDDQPISTEDDPMISVITRTMTINLLVRKMILYIWKKFHWNRKTMKKIMERDHNWEIPSMMEPISVSIKYSPTRKSSKYY
ncbi:hypothetical protein CQW23_34141 [Capsicum baccatum]|uniref:Uncharacterized protein n=1 Tax=Capsicum baccatum TaxID=33114 RepID=A0A2G2UZR9_CAPBA|nr:hypothetical protein CQW23_34141 [Capsicum baccatum]